MQFTQETLTVVAAAATAQTLPKSIVRILSGYSFGALGTAGDTGAAFSGIVTATPTGSQVQFTGTPQVPSNSITLGTAAAAGQVLVFNVVVAGDTPAYL